MSRWRVAPWLALAAVLLAASAAPAASRESFVPGLRIDLVHSTWTRNGVKPDRAPPLSTPAASGNAAAADVRAVVALPCDSKGVRWATTFETGPGRMARLTLRWCGDPDGLLFEVVLDGQRLPPARDAWRPTLRALTSDLGSLWIGPGSHLFEIVAREQPMAPSSVRLSALELEWLGD